MQGSATLALFVQEQLVYAGPLAVLYTRGTLLVVFMG